MLETSVTACRVQHVKYSDLEGKFGHEHMDLIDNGAVVGEDVVEGKIKAGWVKTKNILPHALCKLSNFIAVVANECQHVLNSSIIDGKDKF